MFRSKLAIVTGSTTPVSTTPRRSGTFFGAAANPIRKTQREAFDSARPWLPVAAAVPPAPAAVTAR